MSEGGTDDLSEHKQVGENRICKAKYITFILS